MASVLNVILKVFKNQDEVLNLLCTLLSQLVHLPTKDDSIRVRLQQKAIEVSERYSKEGYKSPASTVSSFIVLKDLLIFFDHYHAKQFNLALKTVADLQIIPLRSSELDEKVANFKRLNIDLCKVVPDILLATMNILFDQYQQVKGNEHIPVRYQDSNIDKQLTYIRDQAKTITNFAGMLPYRMPGDTNSRLVQMEILMH